MHLLLGFLILIISSGASFSSPLFEELWKYPGLSLEAKTIKEYAYQGIKVEEIYYSSSLYKDKPVRIFGYFCYPKKNYQLPAILLIHGGGGGASLPRASSWARRGYAVLAIELPGKGEQRAGSRSSGPNMDVAVLLRTTPDLSDNYLVHAVAAARAGVTYLAQRKEVDPSRMGMVGLSWGGVITLITNGLDQRLKTAVNVFGAGYIYEGCTWQLHFDNMGEGEQDFWKTYVDPKNFLATQHAPILFITGTNDHCYYLPTFQKSYLEVKAPKKVYILPNLRHRFLPEMQSAVFRWLDNHLKWGGSFPQIESLTVYQKDENKIIVSLQSSVFSPLKNAKLYYTPGAPGSWTKKYWKAISAYFEDGIYYFGIPTALLNPEIQFFVNVEDFKGGVGSTLVRSLFKTYSREGKAFYFVSPPIEKIDKHGWPLEILGNQPLTFEAAHYSKENKKYYLK